MTSDSTPTADLGGPPIPPGEPIDLKPGDRIGRYVIRQLLGEGGMGAVFQAEQTEPVRRAVALKVIKLGMDSRAVVARFEAERQALAMMDHPCVAKVLDGGVTEAGRPYFVMELVRGVSITEHCDRHKLGIRDRLELFIRVCDAVQHAHGKGVIHRDLKPANVLVTFQGDEHIPKVIDFGVAKAINQRLTEASVFTHFGQLIGTPEYMSPEQAEMSTQDIDTRSDLYSLGVILYELLSGSRPIEPEVLRTAGLAEIQRIIREVDPPRPSTRLGSGVSLPDPDVATRIAQSRKTEIRSLTGLLRRDLDWVVMKCMEKDRTHRYETAHSLGADIRRYLSNEPVLAGPPTAAYRMRKFVRRHRGGVATCLFVALMLSATAIISTNFYLREMQARKAEQAARERAEVERTSAEAINSFLNDDLLQSVDPDTDGPDVRVVDLLDRAVESVGTRFDEQPDVSARVLSTLGRVYMSLGSPEKAEPLLRDAAAAIESLESTDTSASVSVQASLIESLWRRGQAEEAVVLGERLAQESADREPTDPLRLRVLNQLAAAYKYDGQIEKARPLYEQVLQTRREVLGNEHLDTLRSEYNLALLPVLEGVALRRDGQQEAGDSALVVGLDAMQAAYRRAVQVLGPAHSHTLVCASEVTSQLNRLGKVEQAEPMYRELLATMESRLGASHWRRLQTLANFGRMLQREGRYIQAIPALTEALAGYRDWRGTTNAETLVITRWTAESLAAESEIDRAIMVLRRAIDELGAGHPTQPQLIELGENILRDAGREADLQVWLD